MNNQKTILEVKGLTKRFPGVLALDSIDLVIERNTVCCIVGENGAGKSTFIKILTGALHKDDGEITYNNKAFTPRSTKDALQAGISAIFQELNVIEHLTVEQNLVLGREPTTLGFIRRNDVHESIFRILKELDPKISLNDKVMNLSVAQKQTVEIAKALGSSSALLILDEPTAALSAGEVKRLFSIISGLKTQNMTAIYITHRLEEVFEIGDYLVVFRDGRLIAKKRIEEIESKSEIIRMMIGKVVVEKYAASNSVENAEILRLSMVSSAKLRNINFSVRKGEIVGFYGLMGSGKTEVARILYGIDATTSGDIILNGKKVALRNTRTAKRRGISMVPEERRADGIFANLNVEENISVTNFEKLSTLGMLNRKKARANATRFVDKLAIKCRNLMQAVETLSGGNQQKVVVAKCLNADSKIILLDEPTRGIDVGGKEEIHNLVRELSKAGVTVIVFSSEIPEVLNLCDRIFFLRDGEIVETIANSPAIDIEKIMQVVSGEGASNGGNRR
jgi:ABC-type sugar transport system ATPase subunit